MKIKNPKSKSTNPWATTKRVHISQRENKRIAWLQKWKCAHCRQMLSYTYEVDHIQALMNGGADVLSNMQALCAECHSHKTFEDWKEYRQRQQKQKEEKQLRGLLETEEGCAWLQTLLDAKPEKEAEKQRQVQLAESLHSLLHTSSFSASATTSKTRSMHDFLKTVS